MRILVVEDEQDLNRILAKTLTAEGYSVDACFDGVEALDYLEGAEYDAIVLDVMMPRMDGFSLLAQMRESGNETPVIFLTAKDSVPDRVRGLDAGADDYLVKPFSFDELLARLRVVMRKRGGSATNVFTVAGRHRLAPCHARRPHDRALGQGVCPARIYDPQPRRRALARTDRKPSLEL